MPCIEGAAPIENEVDRIDILYGLGVRQLGVTYSESNALGNGMKEDHDGGLTMFGKPVRGADEQGGLCLLMCPTVASKQPMTQSCIPKTHYHEPRGRQGRMGH